MNDGPIIGDYYGQTTLHPLGLAMVVVLGLTMLAIPRRYAIWPMIAMACFVAPAQRVVVASLNFDLIRVMVVCGWLRVAVRSEVAGFRWRALDTAVAAFAVTGVLVFTFRELTVAALVNRLGASFDTVGLYFLFRILVRDFGDLECAAKSFALICIPVLGAFLVERGTGHNMFAVFGGVPGMTLVREGRFRCQGAFAHPILAGVFWASLLPIIAAQWWGAGQWRVLAPVAVAACLGIIVLCASSTPVSAVGICLLGWGAFAIRRWLKYFCWAGAAVLAALHVAMNKPVWHLLARVDFAGGSTGWHRYHLIDEAVNHFGDWWLVGTASTAEWGDGLQDVTNQYILDGVRGGLWALLLLIAMIVLGFRDVGRSVRFARNRHEQMCAWGLGVSLLIHAVCFISVSYFGQTIVVWYLTLAATASMAGAIETRSTLMEPGEYRAFGAGAVGTGRTGLVSVAVHPI